MRGGSVCVCFSHLFVRKVGFLSVLSSAVFSFFPSFLFLPPSLLLSILVIPTSISFSSSHFPSIGIHISNLFIFFVYTFPSVYAFRPIYMSFCLHVHFLFTSFLCPSFVLITYFSPFVYNLPFVTIFSSDYLFFLSLHPPFYVRFFLNT